MVMLQLHFKVKEFSLPPRFNLLMGDVSAGSVTTSMSRQVLAWLASGGEEAQAHWNLVAATNTRVEKAFETVSALAAKNPAAYNRVLDMLAVVPAAAWESVEAATSEVEDASAAAEILAALIELHAGLQKVRPCCLCCVLEPNISNNHAFCRSCGG